MSFDFLAEYKKLQLQTPRLSAYILSSENSNYTYNVEFAKNCYLIANAVENENCMYGRDFYGCEDCIDCDHVKKCTLCYQCLNCDNCYNCNYLQDSLNCSDCSYGYFLKGCQNCFGCIGLKHKKFHIFNEPYSEKEYYKRIKEIKPEETIKRFDELKKEVPHLGILQEDSENFTGNCVYHSKNIVDSFDVNECQDGGYLLECKKVNDSWDISILEESELCYQLSSCRMLQNSNFCFFCARCSNVEYSENLIDCQDCFGCISLHRKQYYILNEPYTKEEYFNKVDKIKAHLKEKGLYGKMFIPPVFPFEDTVAIMPTL